ncbi:type II toxin-antitoxin system PemK/MazF family toxin [Actinobacteria bacterium YIM 96077]|uniref:Type II toxin-antitoxin system PemK/MazF family toxin n=1 Tax=Phytoactinopolyspora halophila TaxID=1981511 RepID=A0A329QBI3_9ACTN|nr:type II toxin-antitoxin system PemK/MazF family toxin [Phytoactinopolyspora halophila]AYY13026.1 type II toxin-antitoxin system PemK/MazF family toxin [Actinobacteria bacterium YIM 96077]RAW09713.1 type II toxin-antitoxin system PemK/MazF family toxin [Phytoactinopolyspora halophila]
MKRGEVWTSAGPGYATKPRPVVIIQDDRFDATASITVALVTTDRTDLPLFRIPVEPEELNGLRQPSAVMTDKVMTIRRDQLGTRIGRLSDEQMVQINRALVVFLGIAA